MIQLVPVWAQHYEEFWNSVRKRNLWFIKLRYGSVLMLASLIFSAEYIINIEFSGTQLTALIVINISILLYNFFLYYIRRFVKNDADKFNPLHLSLLQMLLDLYALILLIYYTGSIESPLYMLFIFHMIIGSMILPGFVIYSIAVYVIITITALVFGEYFGFIGHHSVKGFLKTPLYNNAEYITAFTAVLSFVMLVSVMLANKISYQLYKMEKDLYESLETINKAEKEKQKYIMGIVHEIKTPLSALQSYLNLILQKFLGPLNPVVEEKLKRASVRSDEAINLINSILKVSKLRLLDQVSFEDVDIKELLCGILNKQKADASAKNIEVILYDYSNSKTKISGDPTLIEIALSNLISNAIKYVKSNGLVAVTLSDYKKGIEIKVCDNGIGIPEKEQEKIFKDFYRASNVKKDFEGVGLGLSIVKLIIENHSGTISLKSPSEIGSEVRPGTCFVVRIP